MCRLVKTSENKSISRFSYQIIFSGEGGETLFGVDDVLLSLTVLHFTAFQLENSGICSLIVTRGDVTGIILAASCLT